MMESMLKQYVKNRGVWSITDEHMVLIYLYMVHHGLDKDVFKSNEVTDEESWMRFAKSRHNVLHIFESARPNPADGIAWLNGWGYNYAFGHFCFMPHTWGEEALKLGQRSLDYWFDGLKNDEWQLDAILGQIPSTNKHAINFVTKLGMRRLGDIPSIRYKGDEDAKGATLFVIERQ